MASSLRYDGSRRCDGYWAGGAAAVTCYAPVSYISAIIILLLHGVSDGCQPLISLSYGEGHHDRTKQFRNLAYSFAAAVSLLCMGVLSVSYTHLTLPTIRLV